MLDDPFDDPPQLEIPERSPERDVPAEEQLKPRLSVYEDITEAERPAEEIKEEIAVKAKRSREKVMEILGDIPDAEVTAPENVLFVCKLNPVTRDEVCPYFCAAVAPFKMCSCVDNGGGATPMAGFGADLFSLWEGR